MNRIVTWIREKKNTSFPVNSNFVHDFEYEFCSLDALKIVCALFYFNTAIPSLVNPFFEMKPYINNQMTMNLKKAKMQNLSLPMSWSSRCILHNSFFRAGNFSPKHWFVHFGSFITFFFVLFSYCEWEKKINHIQNCWNVQISFKTNYFIVWSASKMKK